MKEKSFVHGAMILGGAALISKILGGIYRIPYQNIVGNEGLALYNMTYPVYTVLLAISVAGFPLATSKFVSEKLAQDDIHGAQRIFHISFVAMIVTGLISFFFMFLGAPWLARAAGDPGATLAFRAMSFALLIVPAISLVRSYFHGWQNMIPTAVSQVSEQIVRVIVIIVLSIILIKKSVEWAAAGAVFGAFAGGLLSVFILAYYYRKHYHDKVKGLLLASPKASEQEKTSDLVKRILMYALPACFGGLLLPLFTMADSYTVSNILQYKGMGVLEARTEFGIYSKALPLVQLAEIFATALALALVPSIAELSSMGQSERIKSRSQLALRLTTIIGIPAAVGLAVLAKPLNMALYNQVIGTNIIAILAFVAIFSTLNITITGILQGLGHTIVPAKNLLIGVIAKALLNIILLSLIGLPGAAMASIIAYLLAMGLNMKDLKKYAKIDSYQWSLIFIKPFLAAGLMAAIVYASTGLLEGLLSGIHPRVAYALIALIGASLGAVVYFLILLWSRTFSEEEIRTIPRVGEPIYRLGRKLKIY